MHFRNYSKLPILLILIFVSLIFSGCSREKKYQRRIFALDTVIEATLYSKKDVSSLLDSLEKLIRRTDSSLSISNPTSDVWKINHRTDSVVHVNPVTINILRTCLTECDLSSNLFDVTVAPLKFLYGLESHQKTDRVPTQLELDSVRQYIGCNHLKIVNDSTLGIDRGVTIDFGGIAKGYLINQIKAFFKKSGESVYLVNLGGDLIAYGLKPDGSTWNIGIQHPRNNTNIAIIPVSNTCVFSSGDYERYFIKDGVRYHHLFDPGTGVPGRKNQSSTVIGKDPMIVDIAVKVAFLMDASDALDYLKSRNLLGVIIDSTGTMWASAQLKNVFQHDSTVTVNYK